MNDFNNRPGDIPVPYATDGQVGPRNTYYYPDYAPEPGGEGMDWERMVRLLWQRKWWILGIALIGAGVGWGITQFVAPEYRTFTTVWLEQSGRRTAGGGPGDLLEGEGWRDVFQSRAVLSPVVEDLRLTIEVIEPDDYDAALLETWKASPQLVSGVYTLTTYSDGTWSLDRDGAGRVETGRIGDKIGESVEFDWQPASELLREPQEIRFTVRNSRAAVFDLAAGLNVDYNERSNIIRATLVREDPREAAWILNALAEQFIEVAAQLKTQKIRNEVEILTRQTEYTSEQLASASAALENYKVNTITLPGERTIPSLGVGGVQQDPVFDDYFSKRLRAAQLRDDLAQLDQVDAMLQNGATDDVLNQLTLVGGAGANPELNSAVNLLRTKEAERQTLMFTYTENEPQVQQATSDVREIRSQIIPSAIANVRRQTQGELAMLDDQLQQRGQELREIPQRSITTARLQSDLSHAQDIHNSYERQLRQAELAAATAEPGIQVLDPAWAPTSPLEDTPGRIIILATLASFGLGVAGVIVLDRLDKRIRYPDQVTGSLGLPVLGVVPKLEAAPDPASPTAAIAVESFRGLRTQIAHFDGNVEGVSLITSPAPREGKSMISANLAISYATAGYKTLLLDGDTRRGRAQEMFEKKRSPGLTDYLMDRATYEQVLQDTGVPNLTLIARGAPGGFNADLLESERMDELLERARAEFEIVVIDGPPLAAGADVLMLGQRSDKVVVVIRAGATKEDLAKAKLETLGNVQLPIVGAVLNAMPKSQPYYEYYVNYYYADAEIAS